MANSKNLKPFNTLTESEQRIIAQKGGIASGIARREKRKFKEIMQNLLEMPLQDGENYKIKIAMALINKAQSGDVRAFECINTMMAEDKNQQELSAVEVIFVNSPKESDNK